MKRFSLLPVLMLICLSLILTGGCASQLKTPKPARPVVSASGQQVLAQIQDLLSQASGGSRIKVDKFGIHNLQEVTTNRRSARQAGIQNAKKVGWSQVKKVRVIKDDFLMPSGAASWWVQVEGDKLAAWVRLGYFSSKAKADEMANLVIRLHNIVTGKG